MIVGVPKEIKEGENRVALTPAGVHSLVREGHRVLVEIGAGVKSGLQDSEYSAEGASIVGVREVYEEAELIVKVKEPLEAEWSSLREGQILFTYLHLAASKALTTALLETGVVGVAYETVQDQGGRLPLLVPMSEVAGRMSVQIAMRFLETDYGGRGVLLSGVPGVPPAEVVVLGGGIVGLNAARIAAGLGAHVTILDVSHEQLKYADEILQGRAATVFSNPYNVARATGYADVVIGAVLVPGAKAPRLVTEDMVTRMKPATVIVDVSVDQGGCVETIHPTSHASPTYLVHDVIHYGVPNIPAAVPRTSTYALTSTTLPYIAAIAAKGIRDAARDDARLARGINTVRGVLTHPAVAEAFGTVWKSWQDLL
jgi:alanine dehydrogenase